MEEFVSVFWPYVELIFGFVLLIKGADILIDGAVSIARRLNISDLVLGMTVVAFGTSAPELFGNITAALKGNSDLAIGNILGSNIANTLLVLGVAAVIRPLAVTKATVWREIPFSLMAAIVFAFLANDRLLDHQTASAISRGDGLVLLVFFSVFQVKLLRVLQEMRFERVGGRAQCRSRGDLTARAGHVYHGRLQG